jgi:hypothetical protein
MTVLALIEVLGAAGSLVPVIYDWVKCEECSSFG